MVGPVNRLTRPVLDQPNSSKEFFFLPLKTATFGCILHRNKVVLTLQPIPSPNVHCSVPLSLFFYSISVMSLAWQWCCLHLDDVAAIRRWCHYHSLSAPVLRRRRPNDNATAIPICYNHPTMMPLSLSFGSSPATSPTRQRCWWHPDDEATITPFRLQSYDVANPTTMSLPSRHVAAIRRWHHPNSHNP